MALDPRQLYLRALGEVLRDGQVSDGERRALERLRAWLGIPPEAAARLHEEVRESTSPDAEAPDFDPAALVREVAEELRDHPRPIHPGERVLLEQLAATFDVPASQLDAWLTPRGARDLGALELLEGEPQPDFDVGDEEPPWLGLALVIASTGGGGAALAAVLAFPELGQGVEPMALRAGLVLLVICGLVTAGYTRDECIGHCWRRPGLRGLWGGGIFLGTMVIGAWVLWSVAFGGDLSTLDRWLSAAVAVPLAAYLFLWSGVAAGRFLWDRRAGVALSQALEVWRMIGEATKNSRGHHRGLQIGSGPGGF